MLIQTKNTISKIAIVLWIFTIVIASVAVARYSVLFDLNAFLGLHGKDELPLGAVQEGKLLVLMFSVSMIGGAAFLIKDFYRSVKYSNLYETAVEDRRDRILTEAKYKLIVDAVYTGRFNATWIYWFLIQPVLSSILGLIAFFIARSGLGVLQGVTQDGDISARSIYLYAVLTFLAGFSSHKFIAWLDRLADKIFSSTLPSVERREEERAETSSATIGDIEALKEQVSNTQTAKEIRNLEMKSEAAAQAKAATQENEKIPELNEDDFYANSHQEGLKSVR